MLRLGLRLTLRSGREALVRLLITAAAVAVGVALLLGVLAEFHAYQANANQACWSCTQDAPVPATLPSHGELWNSSVDFYQGQTISRLDVAALGPGAPLPPGVSRLPGPGTYDASPALAALLKTVPADQLGDRFPGRLAGTIGPAALNGSSDLVIYVGYPPAALRPVPGTTWVTSIDTGGRPAGGAVRGDQARRRDPGGHPDDRHGRVRGEHVRRRRRGYRRLPACAAAARGVRAARHALAVFLGTMVGVLLPAVNEIQSTPAAGELSDILVGSANLSPAAGQRLIHGLAAIPGTAVYPLYSLGSPGSPSVTAGPGSGPATTAWTGPRAAGRA